MGKASRRKAQRVQVAEGPFFRLQSAVAGRALYQERTRSEFEARMAEHNAKVTDAMKAAGLNPQKHYDLDEKSLCATLK